MAKRTIEYEVYYGFDDHARVRFTIDSGAVTAFVVQYETYIKGRWTGGLSS